MSQPDRFAVGEQSVKVLAIDVGMTAGAYGRCRADVFQFERSCTLELSVCDSGVQNPAEHRSVGVEVIIDFAPAASSRMRRIDDRAGVAGRIGDEITVKSRTFAAEPLDNKVLINHGNQPVKLLHSV